MRGLMLGVSSFALGVMAIAETGYAADLPANSKIDAVTVYPAGADVTRTLKIKIPAGENTVIINDLPATALPQSIRIEGKATGGTLQIGSVDTRRVAVPRADAGTIAAQRRAIEDEIEKLKDQKALLQADIQAAEAQKALVTNMTQMPTRPVNGATAAAEPDWAKLALFIGERTAAIQKSILETGLKVRDTDRKIEEATKKLAELAPAPEQRTEVKVFTQASAALDAELTVRYQVGQAGWQPFYDARLATGAKGQGAKLQLVRRASITQRSGEAWTDIALTLSTTRPAANTAAPDLHMLSVDYRPDMPPPPRPMSAPVAGAMREMSDEATRSRSEMRAKTAAAPAMEAAPVVEATADVDLSGFQAQFSIPGKVTVPQNGEQKRVQIQTEDLDVGLVVRTVPRLDQTAYLYAKLTLPKASGVLLPGSVSLFRDGTFVGQGRVPQLAQGEDHELGFGADDLVKVKRVVLEDKKGESGIFTSTRAEDRNFVITVKNLRANPVPVVVLDRIPVSGHQDIKVDATFKPQPTKKDVNDRRGTVQWEFSASPDSETQIAFGYKVSAPAGKPLQYLEKTNEQINQGAQMRF